MIGNVTLTIIKPDAVLKNKVGAILTQINQAGFRIQGLKMIKLRRSQAEVFYGIHRSKPFFAPLVEYMISGPIVVAVLEKENAVDDYRKLIGVTDPAKAGEGTIRRIHGRDVQHNAVHGSDSDANALKECNFFFSASERFSIEGICYLE